MVGLAWLSLTAGGQAGADVVGPWGAAPASTTVFPTPRPFFNYDEAAGGTLHDDIAITNRGDTPLTFDLYPADAYNLPNGAFSLKGAKEPRVDVGAWVKLPIPSVTVPPHKALGIPFSLTVPRNATPGDHSGGIVALLRTVAQPPPGEHAQLRLGVGTRIYLRVPGPLRPGLTITGATFHKRVAAFGSGSGSVTVRFSDTGNTRLGATARVTVTDEFGRTVKRFAPARYGALLPGNQIALVEPWKSLPRIGRFHIKVSVVANGMTRQRSVTSWILPWVLLVLVGLALVAIAVLIWRLRRRRHRRPTPTAASPPPDAPHPSPEKEIVERPTAKTG